MEVVVLSSTDWESGPVVWAKGFLGKFRGAKPFDRSVSVLLETASIHTVGISRTITVVGLSKDLVVEEVRRVSPRSFVRLRGSRYVLELGDHLQPPSQGSRLRMGHV